MTRSPDGPEEQSAPVMVDVAIVGAGFSGLYLLHKLRLMGLSALCIDAADGVGGTWYWNRYPGARCDAMSVLYSFSFSEEVQQAWTWSERYARQPEILAYLNFVADHLSLRKDLWLSTRVNAVTYDDARQEWRLDTSRGQTVQARYAILATGCLSVGRLPDIPGLDSTRLATYHTGSWPHHPVSFAGKRVGVIGTGSSGVQVIPEVAQEAAKVVVFQRTPNFVVPVGNGPIPAEENAYIKAHYPELRAAVIRGELVGAGEDMRVGNRYRSLVRLVDVSPEERSREFDLRWNRGGAYFNAAFADIMTSAEANRASADYVRGKIRELVRDPKTAELLTPTDHPIGAKRICVHDSYYQTYNRPNVSLVDLRGNPIVRIAPDGVETRDGMHTLDALIFATGFDAMTGALTRMNITGRAGASLTERWKDGPGTYLGVAVHGFPNLFLITGPGSPSVLGNVVHHIEQHVDFVCGLIDQTERRGAAAVECSLDAEQSWVRHASEVVAGTLYEKAESWYMGANVPGKPRVMMPYVGGILQFRKICNDVAEKGFEGFEFLSAG
jgi:cyclohexanone monooxygenase